MDGHADNRISSPSETLSDVSSAHERLIDEFMQQTNNPDQHFDETTNSREELLEYFRGEKGQFFRHRLSELVTAFRTRSEQAKDLVLRPLTPDEPEDGGVYDGTTGRASLGNAEPKLVKPKPPTRPPPDPPPPVRIRLGRIAIRVPEWFYTIPRPESFDSHSGRYLLWLSIVTCVFAYNGIAIPYRAAFVDDFAQFWYVWLVADYVGDIINILDLIILKPCIKVYANGVEVSDKKEIVRKYVRTQTFVFDVLAILPLDFFYLIQHVGFNQILRFLRLLKVLSYWELLDRIDQIATNPYVFRVLRSVVYALYIIHVNACIYYYYSFKRGFDPEDDFVYNNVHLRCRNITKALAKSPYYNDDDPKARCNNPGDYNDYIYCFFFSVSMVTIIGNLETPKNIGAMVYSWILWLLGVFVFATLVGQIRDVLKAMKRQEDEFYEVMDAIVEHMHTLKIPKELQDRVRTWLLFNWEQQRTIDEGQYLKGLPTRLKSDLAMEVHFSVIRKVHLFRDVDKTVLEELLLKLQPTVFLPNDYICRRGEIGKEMYIIKSGNLEVVLPDGKVAVTLSPGSVFGEVSLLSLAGGNRRTADVRSKGFSNLYVLSKADLHDVMKDYPDTLEALRAKANDLLNKGKAPPPRPSTPPIIEIIPNRAPTPEMVRIAARVMNPQSASRQPKSQSCVELKNLRDQPIGAAVRDGPDSDASSATLTPEPTFEVSENHPVDSTTKVKSPTFTAESQQPDLLKHINKPQRRRHRVQAHIHESPLSDSDDLLYESPNVIRRKPASHHGDSRVKLTESDQTTSSSAKSHEYLELSAISSDSGMKDGTWEFGALTGSKNITNIKRRLFNSPKITPITSSTPSDIMLSARSTTTDIGLVSENVSSPTSASSARDASGTSDNQGHVTSPEPQNRPSI